MKIVQLIDTLNAGGAERMVVNYGNMLAREYAVSYVVTTRESGILVDDLNDNVTFENLAKRKTFDWAAIKKFKSFINRNEISIVHAHTTSYFFAVIIKFLIPRLKIVWHDHHGNRANSSKIKQLPIVLSSLFFNGVVCVNEEILNWAKKKLFCKKSIYLKNFIPLQTEKAKETNLFGVDGKRIVIVANLRHPKNHLMLLKAFKEVNILHKDWTLHLIGRDSGDHYSNMLKKTITENKLSDKVFVYGLKNDISYILSQCQIGVIASTSEGLPMALLEYGNEALAIITTDVGKCGDIVRDHGIVASEISENELERAMVLLIEDETLRLSYSKKIKDYIDTNFGEKESLKKVIQFYETLN